MCTTKWNEYWAAEAEFAFFRNLLSSLQLAKFDFQISLWSKKERSSVSVSVLVSQFSVLGELHLRTNFAECREIEGLRLRDSNNYRFGKKEKKTNKFGQIYK